MIALHLDGGFLYTLQQLPRYICYFNSSCYGRASLIPPYLCSNSDKTASVEWCRRIHTINKTIKISWIVLSTQSQQYYWSFLTHDSWLKTHQLFIVDSLQPSAWAATCKASTSPHTPKLYVTCTTCNAPSSLRWSWGHWAFVFKIRTTIFLSGLHHFGITIGCEFCIAIKHCTSWVCAVKVILTG